MMLDDHDGDGEDGELGAVYGENRCAMQYDGITPGMLGMMMAGTVSLA